MQDKLKAARAAFPYTIPVLMGYVFMGIAFGILLQSKGYHFGWAFFMALTIYAGSMQFVIIDLLAEGSSLFNAALMTLMVNVRHIFYGLSMLVPFRVMKGKKPYMVFSLTDETYSLLCSAKEPEGVDRGWFLFFIALLNHSYWITGCTLGAFMGSLLSFNTRGIDFVMTALFVVIFVEQWKSSANHLPALTGLVSSVFCLVLFGAKNFILPAMLLMTFIFLTCRHLFEGRREIS